MHVTMGRTAELDIRVERSATLDITMTPTAEMTIRMEKC